MKILRVNKISPLYDLFDCEEGWDNWTRVFVDAKAKTIKPIAGKFLSRETRQKVLDAILNSHKEG